MKVAFKLGVGTDPAEKFHVADDQDSARVLTKLENTADSGSGSSGFLLTGRGKTWYIVSDVGLNGGDNLGFMSDTAGYPPRLMLTPTAVGVGTDSPAASLHVAGDGYFTGEVASDATPTDDDHLTRKDYVDDGLATKASTSHTHSGSDITSGTVPIGQIPTGTSGTTVALGNHTHAGYAASSHTHSASDITSGVLPNTQLPYVLAPVTATTSVTGTVTIDASSGGNNRNMTATGNVQLNAPTNPSDGQVLQIALLASGGARTVTFGSGIQFLVGVGTSFAPASSKVCRISMRYCGLISAWIVEAAAVQV